MLMLVRPPSGGNGTDPPKRRRRGPSPALSLTDAEVCHLRVAIKNAARAFGSWSRLADAIGMPQASLHTLTYGRKARPSGTLAIRVAKAAGVSVETVLSGKLTEAGCCPTCGHRAGAGRVLTGGAS